MTEEEDAHIYRLWEMAHGVVDGTWFVSRFGGGAGFGAYWYCRGCGNPQLGDPPWKALGVEDRCRPCGPGAGFVRCPVDHSMRATISTGKAMAGCNLCRGEGWVEELPPGA